MRVLTCQGLGIMVVPPKTEFAPFTGKGNQRNFIGAATLGCGEYTSGRSSNPQMLGTAFGLGLKQSP